MERTSLYLEVWSRPAMHVAKDFGISNVALAKRCKKMGVPVPPPGYWAKARTGPPPPLPPAETEEEREIRKAARKAEIAAKRKESDARAHAEYEARERIERVPRAVAGLHVVVDELFDVITAFLEGLEAMANAPESKETREERRRREIGPSVKPLHDVSNRMLDAFADYLRATDRPPFRSSLYGAVGRCVYVLFDAAKTDAKKRSEKRVDMKKPKISPQVASALHAALQTVIDAINTPDAVKPPKRRGRVIPQKIEMPDLPPDQLAAVREQVDRQLRKAGYKPAP